MQVPKIYAELQTRREKLLAGNNLANDIKWLIEKKNLSLSFKSMDVIGMDTLVIEFLNHVIDRPLVIEVRMDINLDDICNIEDEKEFKEIDHKMCPESLLKKMPVLTRIKLRILYIIYAAGKEIRDADGLAKQGLYFDGGYFDGDIFIRMENYGNKIGIYETH